MADKCREELYTRLMTHRSEFFSRLMPRLIMDNFQEDIASVSLLFCTAAAAAGQGIHMVELEIDAF